MSWAHDYWVDVAEEEHAEAEAKRAAQETKASGAKRGPRSSSESKQERSQ